MLGHRLNVIEKYYFIIIIIIAIVVGVDFIVIVIILIRCYREGKATNWWSKGII